MTIEKTSFNLASSWPHCMELSFLLMQAELQPAIDVYLAQISSLKLFFPQAIAAKYDNSRRLHYFLAH
jgi:hypothetical protein